MNGNKEGVVGVFIGFNRAVHVVSVQINIINYWTDKGASQIDVVSYRHWGKCVVVIAVLLSRVLKDKHLL